MKDNFWNDFELVEVTQKNVEKRNVVRITKEKSTLLIPKFFMVNLPWVNNERVNLYQKGQLFALRPDKVGLVKVKVAKDGSARINSVNMCLTLLVKTHSCKTYSAWVEEDTLFIRPKEDEE